MRALGLAVLAVIVGVMTVALLVGYADHAMSMARLERAAELGVCVAVKDG